MSKAKKARTPQVRPLRFPLEMHASRDWFGDQAVTDFFNGLSLFFPLGEKDFIESVRPYLKQLKDPALLEQAAAFMKQEAYHSREHDRYNKLLRNHGYPVGRIERRLAAVSKWGDENMPPRYKLAQTCAAEHLTATLADALLADKAIFKNADEVMAALWRWHAVEEIEHKAVAFDVYEAVGGNYPERILNWLVFSIFFIGYGVPKVTGVLMDTDGTGRWRGRQRVLHYMFFKSSIGWRVAANYFKYLKPGFHPWDVDNRHRLTRWNRDVEDLHRRLGVA